MQQKQVLDEARQLKRLNAATRRQSTMYKWIALIAALDALLVFWYDRDMRNVTFSEQLRWCAAICGSRSQQGRGYRRECTIRQAQRLRLHRFNTLALSTICTNFTILPARSV